MKLAPLFVQLALVGNITLVIPSLTTLQSQLEEECRKFRFSVVNLNKVRGFLSKLQYPICTNQVPIEPLGYNMCW